MFLRRKVLGSKRVNFATPTQKWCSMMPLSMRLITVAIFTVSSTPSKWSTIAPCCLISSPTSRLFRKSIMSNSAVKTFLGNRESSSFHHHDEEAGSVLPVGLHACIEHCSRRKQCCFHLCTQPGIQRSTTSSCHLFANVRQSFSRPTGTNVASSASSINALNTCVGGCAAILCCAASSSCQHLSVQQSQLVFHLEHSQSIESPEEQS